ncbi:alpha-N-acetylglucosaminidase TIM-barrel domain-containing protein [Isoptericola sp. NPDC057559]|uniref:alpha-N-acetylglucosaminidase TIM-barrel domain-containing protein n=1 Tax=Isoptericola sp. NPDC057559 TaxID=3346168 RepID=UPI003697E98D
MVGSTTLRQFSTKAIATLMGVAMLATTGAGAAGAAGPPPRTDDLAAQQAAGPGAFDTRPARDVLRRVLGPRYAGQVGLATVAADDGHETFRVAARGGRLVVEGSSTSALLMGVNWYLKDVAKADVSWTGDQLDLPPRLPLPREPITQTSLVAHRFSGNDTEDGYSGPFRTFEDWEREIDVAAMHGVNEMFMPVGADAVYAETLQSFGYSAEEMRHWVPTPGYQPWWLLQNMSGFTTPVSERLLQERADLGRRIADRMRSLGITPVLPGYFGTVPTDFEERNPGAKTVPQGTWSGFTRPDWLAPTDPTFDRVAARFYTVQERVLGPSTMFKMDLLHEGGRAGDIPVGDASVAVQDALEAAHPGAIWVILGWQSNPRPETVAAIDRTRMLVVDGLSDRALKPDRDNDWKGTPYAFGSIWNFGGNLTVGAPIKAWNERFWAWLERPGSALDGVAILPEASGNNPVAMEFLAELPWHDGPVDLDRWFDVYADARYGGVDPAARRAWRVLAGTAYSIPPTGGRSSGHGGLFAATPNLSTTRPHTYAQAAFAYDPAAFAKALPALLDVDPALRGSAAYRYDLVDVARQSVADRSRTLLPQIQAAYQAGDLDELTRLTRSWTGHVRGLDDLLATDEHFLLGPWTAQARAAAGDPQEAVALEQDARRLITSWGPATTDLHDYAYRERSGLLDDYYLPRWERLFDALRAHLETGEAVPDIDWDAMAEEWIADRTVYPTRPSGNAYREASRTLRRLQDDRYDVPLTLRPTGSVTGSGTGPDAAQVTASVTNTNYFAAATGVHVEVAAPAGIEVVPTGGQPDEIGPGETAERTWTVRRTAALPAGTDEVTVDVTLRFDGADGADGSQVRTSSAVLPVASTGRYQLSDLAFSSSRNHDGLHPVARDTVTAATPAGDGAPIRLDGVAFAKGLGTNSNADVRVELGGTCSRLTTVVGVDDAMNHTADGDVVVRVYGDGRLLTQTGVLRSGPSGPGTAAVRLDVDVTGVRQLRLQVDQSDANRYFDALSFGVPTVACASPPPTPLGEGASVTATSAEAGREPAKAVDADLSTGWFCLPAACNGKPASLQVDLGAAHDLSAVRVTPYYADRRSYLYRVEGSADGQAWTLLAEKTAHAPQTDVGDRYAVEGSYRFVRVTGFGNTTNAYSLHLQELAVYGAG